MTTAEQLDTINISVAEYESLKSGLQQLERDNKRLSDQLAVLLKRVFGKSSERLDPNQLALFAAELASIAPEPAPQATPRAPRRLGKGHGRAPFPEHLPRQEIVLDLPDDQLSCLDCAATMKPFGEEVTERGHLVPAQLIIHRYVRKKYDCPEGHRVATAALPESLIARAKYEPSVYAHITTAKYGDHLPLHRLSGIFKRHGMSMPKSTMWEMLKRVDEVVAQPILKQMRKELLLLTHLQADETPVTVRLEDQRGTRKGFVWDYGWKRLRLFVFTMTRQRDGPLSFLGKWSGTLQTDGYSGYDEVTRRNKLVRAGCWSHALRKIKDAVETGAKAAIPLLLHVQRLFWIERALRVRRDWLELHNNDSERSLRHIVTGRKNWLFFGSPRGGEVVRENGARRLVRMSAAPEVQAGDHDEEETQDTQPRVQGSGGA